MLGKFMGNLNRSQSFIQLFQLIILPNYKVSGLLNFNLLEKLIATFNDPLKKPCKNIVEKGENARHQHCLLFPHNVSCPSSSNFHFLSHI